MATYHDRVPGAQLAPPGLGLRGASSMYAPSIAPEHSLDAGFSSRQLAIPSRLDGMRESELMTDFAHGAFLRNGGWIQRVVPLRHTPHMMVKVTLWEANAGFLSLTPERATGPIAEQTQDKQVIQLQTFARVLQHEHAYLMTEEGRQFRAHAAEQLTRMATASRELLCIQQLLSAHDLTYKYHERMNIHGDEAFWRFLAFDRMMFGAVNKNDRPLEHIDERSDETMVQAGGEANAWIVHRDFLSHCTYMRDEGHQYRLGGQESIGRKNGMYRDPSQRTVIDLQSESRPQYTIRGKPSYFYEPIKARNNKLVDPTLRDRSIGWRNFVENNVPPGEEYKTSSMVRRIVDWDTNTWKEITLEDCIQNCILFDADGELVDISRNGRRTSSDDHNREIQFDPFTYKDATTKAWQKTIYVGDVHPTFFGRRFFAHIALLDPGVVKEMITKDNIFQDPAQPALVGSKVPPGALPHRYRDAGSVTLGKIITEAGNSAPLREMLVDISAAPGTVQDRATRMFDTLQENRNATRFANDDALQGWFDQVMQEHDVSARSAAPSKFVVPNFEDIPAFQKPQAPVAAGARGPAQAGPGDLMGVRAGMGAFVGDELPRPGWNQPGFGGDRDVNRIAWKGWLQSMNDISINKDAYAVIMAVLGEKLTRQTLERFGRFNIPPPISFMLGRPAGSFQTRSAIKVREGGDMGLTWYNQARMWIGDDASTTMRLVNYKVDFTVHIHRPQHVFVLYDIYVKRYLGGFGTGMINPADKYKKLGQSRTLKRGDKCMIVIPVPANETSNGSDGSKRVCDPVSLTGYHPNRFDDRPEGKGTPHFSTAYRVRRFLNLPETDGRKLGTFGDVNHLMYSSTTQAQDKLGRWQEVERSTGHIPNPVPGDPRFMGDGLYISARGE